MANINIGMKPEGEDAVRQSFLTLEEHAKKVTLQFREVTKTAQSAGKTVQEEVGDKGVKSVRQTRDETDVLGKSFERAAGFAAALFSADQVRRFVDAVQESIKQVTTLQQEIAKTAAGVAFGTGDTSSQVGQAMLMDSPLSPADVGSLYGSVRGTAPFADQSSINRVVERIGTQGAVAAGMDMNQVSRLAEFAGELVSRGFGADEAVDVATSLLQMRGNQNLTTQVFGRAELVGMQMGLPRGRLATRAGLPRLVAGMRQGLEMPEASSIGRFMSRLDPALVAEAERGLRGSRGALDRAEEVALSDQAYRLSVIAAETRFGAERAALRRGEGVEGLARERGSAEVRRRSVEAGYAPALRVLESWVLSAGDWMEGMTQGARTPQPVRVRIESDDPSARLAGSSD